LNKENKQQSEETRNTKTKSLHRKTLRKYL